MLKLSRLANVQQARLEYDKKARWNRLNEAAWVRSSTAPCRDKECPNAIDVDTAKLTQGLAERFKRYTHEQPEKAREGQAFTEYEAKAKQIGL